MSLEAKNFKYFQGLDLYSHSRTKPKRAGNERGYWKTVTVVRKDDAELQCWPRPRNSCPQPLLTRPAVHRGTADSDSASLRILVPQPSYFAQFQAFAACGQIGRKRTDGQRRRTKVGTVLSTWTRSRGESRSRDQDTAAGSSRSSLHTSSGLSHWAVPDSEFRKFSSEKLIRTPHRAEV